MSQAAEQPREDTPANPSPMPLTASRFYLRPVGLLGGGAAAAALHAGQARLLAGGCYAFTHCEAIQRGDGPGFGVSRILSLAEVKPWAETAGVAEEADNLLADLSRPRPLLAGLPMDCPPPRGPLVMGVVNVTPDSFSDGGDYDSPQAAVAHGEKLLAEGADILDIGGESTRPGAPPVPLEEELRRVLPVVRGLAAKGAMISIDTRKAAVMEQALAEGAVVINDVSALTGDPRSLAVAADSGAPVILMHMRGDPRTMQDDPQYDCALLDVYDALRRRVNACLEAGIERSRIVVDPGIGFGKTSAHNAEILAGTSLLHGLGCGLLIGVSRKRFVAGLSRGEAPKERLPGSLAAGLDAVYQGAQILRVHDVAETQQALAVWSALLAAM